MSRWRACYAGVIGEFRTERFGVLVTCLLTLLLLSLVTGRIRPHLVPDSATYLQHTWDPPSAAARSIRPPGYPLLLDLLLAEGRKPSGAAPDSEILAEGRKPSGAAPVPQFLAEGRKPSGASPGGLRRSAKISAARLTGVVIIQIAWQAIAAAALILELRRWRVVKPIAYVAGAVLAVGCPFWDHVSTIATDSLAASIAAMIGVVTLAGWRKGFGPPAAVGLSLLTLMAISLRPAALYLIAAVPLAIAAGWCPGLTQLASRPSRREAPTLAILCYLLPIGCVLGGWCFWRGAVTGDYGLLPFGHINLAGVTIQLVSPEELRDVGPDHPVAYEIFQNPLYRGRAMSTMEIEDRWDAQSYFVAAAAAALNGGDAVDQNRILGGLNRSLILAHPGRYIHWVLLSVRRGIWGSLANLAMHPIYLMIGLSLIAAVVRQIMKSQQPHRPVAATSVIGPLFILAATHAACLTVFVSLSSPAIGRLVDPGWIFVPVWAVVATLSWLWPDRLNETPEVY